MAWPESPSGWIASGLPLGHDKNWSRSTHQPSILVLTTTVPDDRKTLATVRSLTSAGWKVAVAGDRHLGQAYYSRRVDRLRLPPADDADGSRRLADLLEKRQTDVVLPTSDLATRWLADQSGSLPPQVRYAVSVAGALTTARDKALTLAEADRLGIRTPHSIAIPTEDDLLPAAREIGFPCVLKPRIGSGAVGQRVPVSLEGLVRSYRSLRGLANDGVDTTRPLLQRWVAGETHDACVLFRKGEPRAALTQRRILTYPEHGGVGVLAETTRQPALLEQAIELLRKLRWHGPAQVEFKLDPLDDKQVPTLIEINGRFWGTLALSISAGIDFPLLAARLALDGDVEPSYEYRNGVRYRWPFPYAMLLMSFSRSGWRSTLELLRPSWESHWDLRLADPLPHLAELGYAAARLVRPRLRIPR